jgi:molecular chaperone DnaK
MRLFISYARIDKSRIQILVDLLENAGHEPWFDIKLLPGQDWKAILLKEIHRCDAFVYTLSPDSISSEWCQWEFAQAVENNKPIIPILIHKQTKVPNNIAHYHYADFSDGPTSTVVAQLMGGLTHIAITLPKQTVSNIGPNPNGIPAQVMWTTHRRTISQQYLKKTTLLPKYQNSHSDNAGIRENLEGIIIGIDFGTTNSMCAVLKNGKPTLIPNRFGYSSTPSAVAIDLDGNPIVGETALKFLMQYPERGVLEVKRLFGGEHYLEVDGISYDVKTLASFVIESLRRDAESYLGTSVNKAVLTAPAYFDQYQLGVLRVASRLAGIQVMRIIAEPTAACLSIELNDDEANMVVVYDIGGGTFDVSIIEVGDGLFEVRSINGDSKLGGLDYDKILVDYCNQIFNSQTGIDLSNNLIAQMRIREEVEKAKIVLSNVNQTTINVPYIYGDNRSVYNMNVPITRPKFQELTYHLVEESIKCCEQALRDAWMEKHEIDHVVLVGLSTKTPSIYDAVREFFKQEPIRGINPDKVVVMGAAIQAGVLAGDIKDLLLLDVIGKTLSIETSGGIAIPVFKRNTTIPTMKSVIFSTSRDNQTIVEIHIVEGEHSMANKNTSLAILRLTNIPPAPKGTPQILVQFKIDENNILTVEAYDKPTNIGRKLTLDIGENQNIRLYPIEPSYLPSIFEPKD